MRHSLSSCVAMITALVLTPGADAAVRYVDASASGANTGESWTNAYNDLQAALAAAQPGDELWVADGIYTPGAPGDVLSSFELRDGVALYGGFAGGESSRAHRNPALNATILSGDVGNDDTYNPAGGWPGGYSLNTPNSGHVVIGSGVSATARLDGFTVTRGAYGPSGTPASDPLLYGSGLYVIGGSPTIVDCGFTMNLAAFGPGGAVFLNDSNATITGCRFELNYVHLGSGGAIYLYGDSQPSIAECVFRQNIVTSYNGSEGQGGAIENRSALPLTISGCLFEYNEARPFSAGSYEVPRGGGISSFAFDTPVEIRDCVFRYNRAAYGAGLFVWNPTTVVNCLFEHNTAFVYAGSGGVSVGGEGAGLASQWTDTTLVNCTVAYNSGQESAGVRDISDPANPVTAGSTTLWNTVVWGNIANGQDVAPIDAQIKGHCPTRYSCVQDLFTPIPGEDPPNPADFPGCFDVNPQLVSASDLHLANASPCIDAGRNSYVPSGLLTDLDGLARFFDDPAVTDTGLGAPPLVDMGCYEAQPTPCPGDVDGDRDVDLTDLAILLANFDATDATREMGDLDGDGLVSLTDLALLLSLFDVPCS